ETGAGGVGEGLPRRAPTFELCDPPRRRLPPPSCAIGALTVHLNSNATAPPSSIQASVAEFALDPVRSHSSVRAVRIQFTGCPVKRSRPCQMRPVVVS